MAQVAESRCFSPKGAAIVPRLAFSNQALKRNDQLKSKSSFHLTVMLQLSRSITSLQQGRSGRLGRRPSRSITSLRQGGVDAGREGREILITPASYHQRSSASATRSTEQFGTSTVSRTTLKSRTTTCKTNYALFHVSLRGGC